MEAGAIIALHSLTATALCQIVKDTRMTNKISSIRIQKKLY